MTEDIKATLSADANHSQESGEDHHEEEVRSRSSKRVVISKPKNFSFDPDKGTHGESADSIEYDEDEETKIVQTDDSTRKTKNTSLILGVALASVLAAGGLGGGIYFINSSGASAEKESIDSQSLCNHIESASFSTFSSKVGASKALKSRMGELEEDWSSVCVAPSVNHVCMRDVASRIHALHDYISKHGTGNTVSERRIINFSLLIPTPKICLDEEYGMGVYSAPPDWGDIDAARVQNIKRYAEVDNDKKSRRDITVSEFASSSSTSTWAPLKIESLIVDSMRYEQALDISNSDDVLVKAYEAASKGNLYDLEAWVVAQQIFAAYSKRDLESAQSLVALGEGFYTKKHLRGGGSVLRIQNAAAAVHMASWNLDKAITEYSGTIESWELLDKESPGLSRHYLNRAKAYGMAREFQKSSDDFEVSLRLSINSNDHIMISDILGHAAQMCIDGAQYKHAKVILDAYQTFSFPSSHRGISDESRNNKVKYLLGLLHFEQGNYSGAASQFATLREANYDASDQSIFSADARLYHGRAQYFMGDCPLAQSELAKSIAERREAGVPLAVREAEAWHALARNCGDRDLGQLSSAMHRINTSEGRRDVPLFEDQSFPPKDKLSIYQEWYKSIVDGADSGVDMQSQIADRISNTQELLDEEKSRASGTCSGIADRASALPL